MQVVEISPEGYWGPRLQPNVKLGALKAVFGFASEFLWMQVWSELGSVSASDGDPYDEGLGHLPSSVMKHQSIG